MKIKKWRIRLFGIIYSAQSVFVPRGNWTIMGCGYSAVASLVRNKRGKKEKFRPEQGYDGKSKDTIRRKTTSSYVLENEVINVKPEIIPAFTLRAAVLIQQWYRRHLARMEARQRCTWSIFQSLEYVGEQDQLKLYNFFNNMITHLPDLKPKLLDMFNNSPGHSSNNPADEEKLLNSTSPSLIDIESSYKGPHVNTPLTRQDLDVVLQAFKLKKVLHAKYVLQVLHEAREFLRRLPNIHQASTALSGQITVCGDLHGKLDDLYVIFYKNGLPSGNNPYVFNGDFVDRGKYSVEVFLVLLICMIVAPGGVYLNRGNHEDHVMNLRYGFIREITIKYKYHASKVIHLFEDVFGWLPLATVIDNRVLVVHGGISNETDLDWIRRLDRHRYLTLLRAPDEPDSNPQSPTIKSNAYDNEDNIEPEEHTEWKQVLDLLWSDPVSQPGCTPNTFRGGGTYFGPDITEQILSKHGLQLLIRSHECKTDGYEFSHDDKCLTVFSASNYYEMGSNRGAYVKMVGKELIPQFVQYSACKARKVSVKDRLSHVEKSALRRLSEMIYASKFTLMNEFQKYDPDSTGFISLSDWCTSMATIVQLNLPWRMLRERLVTVDPQTLMAQYETTFNEFALENGICSSDGAGVVEVLYRNKSTLETIFRLMDKDNSGHISMEEFEEACHLLGQHLHSPISSQYVKDIAACIDINRDGVIDFNEFLEAFRLVDRSSCTIITPTDDADDIPEIIVNGEEITVA